jgi:hypothetical protein
MYGACVLHHSLTLVRGPLCLLRIELGTYNARGLGLLEVMNDYIRSARMAEIDFHIITFLRSRSFAAAVLLLDMQSWRNIIDCIAAVTILATALLKEKLTQDIEVIRQHVYSQT